MKTCRTTDLSDIEAALAYVPNNDRDTWLEIGMALHSELGESGFPLWDDWSSTADNYKEQDARDVWRSFKPGAIGIGTLFHHAQQQGWKQPKNGTRLNHMQDEAARQKRQQEAAQAEQDKAQSQAEVADKCAERWAQATTADPAHSYLARKQCGAHGIRQEGDHLLIPMADSDGKLWSLQTIAPDGRKLFAKGSRAAGMHFRIKGDGPVVICEGYATGASIHAATGYNIAVAFSCNSLKPVAEAIRAKLPDGEIIIAADAEPAETTDKARAVAQLVGARVAVPSLKDFNDTCIEEGFETVKQQIDAAQRQVNGTDTVLRYPTVFYGDIRPNLDTTALVTGLIKPETLVVTYGESGSGKTFDALHRDLCIASGSDYFGRSVERGLVVYLAAEGGDSTLNRVYAYREHLFPDADFILIPYSMDLLHPDGDVDGVIDHIKRIEDRTGKGCVKVTQDTLARAMPGGNENAGDDMGRLVAHADRIRHAIGNCFEFIHHAGKDTARGARGHSSLKAATDTELEVSVANEVHYVRATKQRDFALGDEFAFTLRQVEVGTDQHGQPVTTCIPVVSEINRQAKDQQPTPEEKLAIQTLEEAFRLHQRPPPSEVLNAPENRLNGSRNVCPVEEWHRIYDARKSDDRTKPDSVERAFRRYRDSLQTKGIIKIYQGWVWFLKG